MEIVIALLILIGALTVGTNSSTSDEAQAEKNLARSEQAVNESGVDARQVPCRLTNGRLVQRDLTVRRSSTIPPLNDATRKAEPRCCLNE